MEESREKGDEPEAPTLRDGFGLEVVRAEEGIVQIIGNFLGPW